jgi:hypothetical protein
VGKQALINGQEATIIGVAPKGFRGTEFALDFDGYVPMNLMPTQDAIAIWSDRTARALTVMGRLKIGREPEASAKLDGRSGRAVGPAISRNRQGSNRPGSSGETGAAAAVSTKP